MAMYEQAFPQPFEMYSVETPFTAVRDDNFYEVDADLFEEPQGQLPSWPTPNVHQRMNVLLGLIVFIITLLSFGLYFLRANNKASAVVEPVRQGNLMPASVQTAVAQSAGHIAPLFTAEIQYWAPQIERWAAEFGLDPNMVATVMQVESCGDPKAISRSNAQGLFQVMPFHFTEGENMLDPDTNARRGMAYLAERLVQTNGEVGNAFAGYNGGHVAAAGSWDTWVHETQRYYVWTTGIYADAKLGKATSETLEKWLQAGGASLCNQASTRLNLR